MPVAIKPDSRRNLWREESLMIGARDQRGVGDAAVALLLTLSRRKNSLGVMRPLTRCCLAVILLLSISGFARDYRFDGSMSEEVLRSYLSRSMTSMYLLTSHGNLDDNIRLMTNCGVKFAGRALYQWGREEGGESAKATRCVSQSAAGSFRRIAQKGSRIRTTLGLMTERFEN